MKIEWARGATRQLMALHAYVAADKRDAADRLLLRIMAAVQHLASYPLTGREGRVPGTRELVIARTPYLVAYRLKDDRIVEILAILHGKRRWPEGF